MSETNALTAKSVAGREWSEIRCRCCNAFFLKAQRSALKPGAALEIKCYKCNAINYAVGDAE